MLSKAFMTDLKLFQYSLLCFYYKAEIFTIFILHFYDHYLIDTIYPEEHPHNPPFTLFFPPVFPLKVSRSSVLSETQSISFSLPPLLPPTLPPPLSVTALHKLRWVFFTLSRLSPFALHFQDAMRLTALWLCGTLLALTSLPRTATNSGEGDILGDNGFGPCAATLRLEGACRQGQDENTCPYLFSLPPLTVHLPKQLRELEKIVKDLQKLKDNVDQLRKMCADCTVSQSERECGRQSEKEREKLSEGTERHGHEKKWMNERDPGKLNDCRTDRVKVEKTMEGNGDTDTENRTTLEEKERKTWEAERQSEKGVIKDEKEGPIKEVTEKDENSQTDGAKGKDKLGQANAPTAGGKERMVDMARENVFEDNNRDADNSDRNKEKHGKGFSKGEQVDKLDGEQERKMTINIKNTEKIPESDRDVRQDETKETEKKSQNEEDRGSDGIKMSEEHDEHTNKEQKQHSEEKKKETEKGIKGKQNNEKSKQTENIGSTKKEKTIKEEEAEEVDSETGKEIKTEGEKNVQSVQRDSDGESASSKATDRTDFVSISPTPRPTIGLDVGYDSVDSNEATTLTSSLPSPPLSSSTSHLIADVNQQTIITASELPTQSTGAAGISEHSNRPTTTDTINKLGGSGQQTSHATIRLISTTSVRPRAGFQGQISSATPTTTPSDNLYTTTFPGVTDHSRWTAKNNSSNTKTGVKPLPGPGPKPDKKHKPGIKPEADQGQKNPKNYRKPDRAPLPDKKPKHEQKQEPSNQKPTTDRKPKPGKDTKHVQIVKPDQRALLNNLTTDQNLKNNLIPKHGQARTTDKNKLPNQKPNSRQKSIPPVQRPTSQIPVNVNVDSPDKDPLTDQQPEYDEISIINRNSKPDKKLYHPPKTNKPDQKQTPGKKTTSKEKSKPDQRSEPNQNFTQESESERSETTRFTSKPKPNHDENPSSEPKSNQDSKPGQNLTPAHTIMPPDQKPKSSQKIPKINQRPKPGHMPKFNQKHPVLVTEQKPKPNVKPKPGQTPQTNQGNKTPVSDQMPNLKPKSVPGEIPEAGSSRTVKPRPPPRHRPPTTPLLKPGATPLKRPKPGEQPKPSAKTKAGLDLLHFSVTTSNSVQNSQTELPPTFGAGKQTDDVTHSPGNTEFSPSTMKIITLGPKTYNSLETRSFTHIYSLPERFTMSPHSRITSDMRPQTVGQPSSIPETTRPNNIIHGSLPSVISSESPGSTKSNLAYNTDSNLQPTILPSVEETAPRPTPDPDKMMISVPSHSPQTTSTVSPDFRSTTSANSGPKLPDAESSTPSARELRVKINQVAALLNNSLDLNERPLDRGPKEHLEDNQGGSRPDTADSKLPTLTSSQGKIIISHLVKFYLCVCVHSVYGAK